MPGNTVTETAIAGLYILNSDMVQDSRGFFRESYQLGALERALGREARFRQGNHSRSRPRVLRGFHSEPWDKLIYVARGTATCVVADARPDSPSFGQHVKVLMGDTPGQFLRLFVSRGLSNAFYCHTEVDYINDVSEEFSPRERGGLAWDDPDLAVPWDDNDPLLSPADRQWPSLRSLYPDHPKFTAGAQ